MKQALKLYILAALAAVVLGLLACFPVSVVPVEFQSERQYGQVVCDIKGAPVILVDKKQVGRSEMKYILIHEETHVRQIRQMQRFGGCRETVIRFKEDLLFALAMETEAYCNVARARLRDNPSLNREEIYTAVREVLAYIYTPTLLTIGQIRTLPCQ